MHCRYGIFRLELEKIIYSVTAGRQTGGPILSPCFETPKRV